MATLIPSLSSSQGKMTPGERRFAARLEQKLEDDYLLWYDVPIGPKRLYPDFIILHPSRGIFVLEVKDWKADIVKDINPLTCHIMTVSGLKEVDNPLVQARRNALAIHSLLEQDRELVHANDSRHAGKLITPFAYGVILTNITRKVFEQNKLEHCLRPHLVICQDEMYESVDQEEFQKRIWDMAIYQFGNTLTQSQVDRIRWHLFPELRINHQQLSLFDKDQPAVALTALPKQIFPDIIQIMDLQQEQLARTLGDQHRIIQGAAGSGKTLILAYRCKYLVQQNYPKPILILCFNVPLASRLKQILVPKVPHNSIIVRHFHGWCMDQHHAYGIPLPHGKEDFLENLVHQVIQATVQGKIPGGQYSAVMIDEGHDFAPEWLKLLTQQVDPATNSLLLLYDDAQNLYGQTKKKTFTFKSVGIQAQGRTTILKINYRNTTEVLALAYEFAREVMVPDQAQEDDVPILVQPTSAGRHGPQPELIRLSSFNQEARDIALRLHRLHEQNIPWNEMAVLYRINFMGVELEKIFKEQGIPVEWVSRDSKSRNYDSQAQSVKLLTLHSAKGLEFPVICIPGLGYMPIHHSTPQDEARLLYVGMTRAITHLVLTHDRESEFTKQLQTLIGRLQ